MNQSRLFTELQKNFPKALLDRIWNQSVEGLQGFYSQVTDLIRESSDAQFGIVSGLVEVEVDGKKEYQWVRDATNAIPLEKRIAHDGPIIEANNALLRSLGRLRAIDFAVAAKHTTGTLGDEIREQLKRDFHELTRAVLDVTQTNKPQNKQLEQIKNLETAFNTKLVHALYQADLTQGCTSKKDAEALLSHYRNLSSLVEPARTLVTLTFDEKANVLQRETQYPVTEKTPAQKKKVHQLKVLQPHPHREEKNAHNAHKLAHQVADSFFADLLLDDATLLPCQSRNTHHLGTKNSFIVKSELIVCSEKPKGSDLMTLKAKAENTLWLARTAAPVYIGKGLRKAAVQEETRQNLDQIRKAAEYRTGRSKLSLHITSLTTNSPIDKEDKIVNHLFDATRKRGNSEYQDDISYAPANIFGTFHRLDLARNLQFAEGKKPGDTLPLQQFNRLKEISKIILAAAEDKSRISLLQCASGQDRTGTAIEYSTQIWMKERYQALGLNARHIEKTRAAGGNVTEMATHLVPGSPGLKSASKSSNWMSGERPFSKQVTKHLYLKSASTNRSNKVKNVDFLKLSSDASLEEFNSNLRRFLANLKVLEKDKKKQKLYQQGMELAKQIQEFNPKTMPKDLSDCNTLLVHANLLLTSTDKEQLKESGKRLASLSKVFSAKSGQLWKNLASLCLAFVCTALILAGILGAIPSGGASIALIVFGGLGIGASVAQLEMQPKTRKEFANSVSFFKTEVEKNQKDKPEVPDQPIQKI